MSTNAQIIDAIAQAHGDAQFRKRTSATFAQILTDQQDELNEEFDLLQKVDSSTLTLVADTAAPVGTFPADFVKFTEHANEIEFGQISVGTNGILALAPITLERLDAEHEGWRDADAGTPKYFYITKGAAIALGFYPRPSAAWITANGNPVFMLYTFQPTAAAYDSANIFGGATRFRGLEKLLKMMALRQLNVEDTTPTTFPKVLEYDKLIAAEREHKMNVLTSILRTPGGAGFNARNRSS